MISISFQNSDEFKTFTSKVCSHLSKTKLNQLRSAIAKEIGHHHLSTLYHSLDSGSSTHSSSSQRQDPKPLGGINPSGDRKNSVYEDLGFSEQQASDIEKILKPNNHGMLIVSGVTGAGKSETLRAIYKEYIEYRYDNESGSLKGVAIEDCRSTALPNTLHFYYGADPSGESFKSLVRSVMLMDPDLILVDEMRNKEQAINVASMRKAGFDVLSTIHAQHALAIPGMLNRWGVTEAFDHRLFSGLIHQTLVKKLCKHCSMPVDLKSADKPYMDSILRLVESTHLSRDYSGIRMRNHDGCNLCRRGVETRTVVAEVIPVTEQLMKALKAKGGQARQEFIEQGGMTFQAHAIEKVLAGEVDPVDAESVVGPMSLFPEQA